MQRQNKMAYLSSETNKTQQEVSLLEQAHFLTSRFHVLLFFKFESLTTDGYMNSRFFFKVMTIFPLNFICFVFILFRTVNI